MDWSSGITNKNRVLGYVFCDDGASADDAVVCDVGHDDGTGANPDIFANGDGFECEGAIGIGVLLITGEYLYLIGDVCVLPDVGEADGAVAAEVNAVVKCCLSA